MDYNKTFRLLISGRVQGVGFRYFAEDQAQRYNITGYVRNTFNNKVEIVCQGNQQDLKLFFLSLKKGPTFANITDFHIESFDNLEQYKHFEIKY